jgi:hypothetical protein
MYDNVMKKRSEINAYLIQKICLTMTFIQSIKVRVNFTNSSKQFLYENVFLKLLWVEFINILHKCFLYNSAQRSFPLVTFWLWQKDFGKNSTFVQKMCA